MLAVAAVMCFVVPFILMPAGDVAVALPVIMVPGEEVWSDFLDLGFPMTNTVIGTLVADVLVLAFALGATRRIKEVPGRLQGLFEVMTDALYGLAKSTAGHNARKIFPLMATIFLFLLIANWVKLVPGAESIGLMHCAHEGVNGYEKNGATLKVSEALDPGTRATEENYELCHDKEEGHAHHNEVEEIIQDALLVAAADELDEDSISYKDDVGNDTSMAEYLAQQNEDEDIDVDASEVVFAAAGIAWADLAHALESGEIEAELLEEELAALHAEEPEVMVEDLAAEDEGQAPARFEDVVEHVFEEKFYRDDLYAVTPFVRGAATDLNLTLGLGFLAFIAIQYFGVTALGIGYFSKFINTPALENIGKRPMGLMDFVVGLLEIISELAKIVSFGFRLFGNLFAGGVLLFVMSFLVAMLVPAGVYVLELFVGLIQAFVFAMLLLVFSSIAMQGHDHGEEH
ncbi:MAG: F0F1 ATP synthase subunit A [Chloroflexi bacterium]|nr:F0F1 ATP synthase subunit A [Chloroflexota bacterium]